MQRWFIMLLSSFSRSLKYKNSKFSVGIVAQLYKSQASCNRAVVEGTLGQQPA